MANQYEINLSVDRILQLKELSIQSGTLKKEGLLYKNRKEYVKISENSILNNLFKTHISCTFDTKSSLEAIHDALNTNYIIIKNLNNKDGNYLAFIPKDIFRQIEFNSGIVKTCFNENDFYLYCNRTIEKFRDFISYLASMTAKAEQVQILRENIRINLEEHKDSIFYDDIRRKFNERVNNIDNWIVNSSFWTEPFIIIRCNIKEIYEMYLKAVNELGLKLFEPYKIKCDGYYYLYVY